MGTSYYRFKESKYLILNMKQPGEIIMKYGDRLRGLREGAGLTLQQLAEKAGLPANTGSVWIHRAEKGAKLDADKLQRVLRVLGYGVDEFLDERGRMPENLDAQELEVVATWRRIQERDRGAVQLVLERVAAGSEAEQRSAKEEHVAEPKPTDIQQARERREERRQTLRLVGYVAARGEGASVDFEDRLGDEEEAPPGQWTPGRHGLVKVRGESCAAGGIPTDSLVLVERAELGTYRRGDIVIATTPSDGMVCKRYAGQGRAAKPKQPPGVIVLESVGEGQRIVGPKADGEREGIEIRAIARWVRPPGGEWRKL